MRSSGPVWKRIRSCALLAIALLGSPTVIRPQSNTSAPGAAANRTIDAFFATTPFSTWLGTNPKPQIPWRVQILPTDLSYYQRIHLRVFFQVAGKQVWKRVPQGGLAFLYQVTDASGGVFQDHLLLKPQDLEKGVKKGNLEVTENMLVVPGAYQLDVALYDLKTGEYSFQRQRVDVPLLDNDSLPNAWPDAPHVQFFEPDDPGFKIFAAPSPVRLNLPLNTQREVHLHVIFDFTVPARAANSRSFYYDWLSARLGEIAALTQIHCGHGGVEIEIVDAAHGTVVFEQKDAAIFDWQSFQQKISSIDPTKVDLSTLQHSVDGNVFLYRTLQSSFDQASSVSADGSKPLNVYIFAASLFVSAPAPFTLPAGTDCVIYYIYTRMQPPPPQESAARNSHPRAPAPVPHTFSGAELLDPLHPQFFQAGSPEEFRRALGKMLSELSGH
ncbi:MAG TPA: hypothetical protein VFO34_06025 [Candidatus Acidoferrales bacterium]|nr:hypothetical protein [Candidatus Acidoferrales bacterium]